MAAKSARDQLSVTKFVLCVALFGEQVRHIQARIHASLLQRGLGFRGLGVLGLEFRLRGLRGLGGLGFRGFRFRV